MAPSDEDMGYEDVDYGAYCVEYTAQMQWRILGVSRSRWAASFQAQADFHRLGHAVEERWVDHYRELKRHFFW